MFGVRRLMFALQQLTLITLGVGRSSFGPLTGATARQVSACHTEALGVGGVGVIIVLRSFG
jgi:hypothetical protein